MIDCQKSGLDVRQIGLGLYIHIPWCVKKCPYCDFNSHTLNEHSDFGRYVDALICDIRLQKKFAHKKITSIFIGGGTPSLLPINEFKRLFDAIFEHLPVCLDCEITLEANPATLEHAPFEQYLALGINRLSLGVQSFDDKMLVSLGRIHNSTHAKTAIQLARQAGFERINADIMHGLPNQSVQSANDDLKIAIALGVSHISWYQLTIEPNTVFYRTQPVLPSETVLDKIELSGQKILTQSGFSNYEISAWVGKDTPCRHNMNYWQFGDYLAIGAGAHGKITIDDSLLDRLCGTQNDTGQQIVQTGVYRFSKSRLPKDYMNFETFPKMVDFCRVADDDLPFEFMMNVLRLKNGVNFEHFKTHTGLDLACIQNTIKSLHAKNLLRTDKLATTDYGYRYANQIMQAFL